MSWVLDFLQDLPYPLLVWPSRTFSGAPTREKEGACFPALSSALFWFAKRPVNFVRGGEMEGDPKTRSPKRARGGADRAFFCLVDGCESDLTKCKEYHRRHKVCEAHSKTPVVLVLGQQQRFCQQCSRFHLLEEFDEVKRSCRRRLDGHNRRRRKPHLPSVSGCIVPNPHGLEFYERAQAFSIGAVIPPKCLPLAKNGGNSLSESHLILNFDNNQQCSISTNYGGGKQSTNYGGGKQFPFLQDDGSMSINAKETAVEDPWLRSLDAILPPDCGNNGTSKTFSCSLPRVLHPSSAPSLLSSMTQTSTSNLYPIVPAMNQLPFGWPSNGLNKYHHLHISNHVLPTACLEIENDNVGALLVPDASDIDHRSPSVFHMGGGGSPDGPLQAVPFSWS